MGWNERILWVQMKKNTSLLPWSAAACVAFLCASTVTSGSILLSSGDFTVLGGTSITSTGTVGTVISNGNVGVSPGTSITGFFASDGGPAIIENGAIIGTGPVTDQARLDLGKVQVGLAGMAADANLSNVDMGGMTLLPGVYKFDVAAALTGALVLDGNGQNDAFWVFQIGTSLNTSVNSTVTVINPGSNLGSDYGVFWNAGAEIITGANNTLLGNYLSGTSITFGAQSDGGARALAMAAVTLDQNKINATGGLGGNDWTGGLMYDAMGGITAVPEPSTYAAMMGLSIFSLVVIRRRRRALAAA